jgi:hypothetical protein
MIHGGRAVGRRPGDHARSHAGDGASAYSSTRGPWWTRLKLEEAQHLTPRTGVFPLFWTPDLGCQLTELSIS